SWAVGAPYAMSSGDTDLIVGTVLTYDRPDRLVMTFDARWDELSAVEPAGQLEYLLTDSGDGVTELTVIISGLSGHSAVSVAADTPGIYSGVKSLLETGAPLR
ncbi:MAG: SRPBCC domain-containing protein, partial [Propionibacteriaceae bacterium]